MLSSGPIQSRIGNRELKQRLTATLTLGDQSPGSPSGVAAQFISRMRAPSSPPPWRKATDSPIGAAADSPVIGVPRVPRYSTLHRLIRHGVVLGIAPFR